MEEGGVAGRWDWEGRCLGKLLVAFCARPLLVRITVVAGCPQAASLTAMSIDVSAVTLAAAAVLPPSWLLGATGPDRLDVGRQHVLEDKVMNGLASFLACT